MKLQQLEYIWAISQNDLNASKAAKSLHTSQPGISKQLRLLEEELGVEIFCRSGKNFSRITSAGEKILGNVEEILHKIESIKSVGKEFCDPKKGSLGISTTHTQCRYKLPPVINEFLGKYPEVSLNMHQGTPMQISELAANGSADFAIATEALEFFSDLVMMPCYRWNRAILVPKSHPLAKVSSLNIENISKYPLVTYTFGFTGRSKLDEAFNAKGLTPKVVFTASDADVIKTYVRLGLGVGIVAKMAHDSIDDSDLIAIDAGHLFESSITKIGFRRGMFLRDYMYDFIEIFAPHLTRGLVEEAIHCRDNAEIDELFRDVSLRMHGE